MPNLLHAVKLSINDTDTFDGQFIPFSINSPFI